MFLFLLLLSTPRVSLLLEDRRPRRENRLGEDDHPDGRIVEKLRLHELVEKHREEWRTGFWEDVGEDSVRREVERVGVRV